MTAMSATFTRSCRWSRANSCSIGTGPASASRIQDGDVTLRRLISLALLSLIPFYAAAAKRITVSQLEQSLTASSAAHKPDAEIARQIGGMELSERLTEATLARLTAGLAADPQTTLALRLLADESAFLDPPASEMPADSAPDEAAQQRMLDAGRSYVKQTVPHLPNLLAKRTTNRYDDSPEALKNGGWGVRAGLHLTGTTSRDTSVLEERDNGSPTTGSAFWQAQMGMISGGEFGSTLGMIMADTLKGKISWAHWEETSGARVAVFRYSVPKSASHYEVIGTLPRSGCLPPGRHGQRRRNGRIGQRSRFGRRPFSKSSAPDRAITAHCGSIRILGLSFASQSNPTRQMAARSVGRPFWCSMGQSRLAATTLSAHCEAWPSPMRSSTPRPITPILQPDG